MLFPSAVPSTSDKVMAARTPGRATPDGQGARIRPLPPAHGCSTCASRHHSCQQHQTQLPLAQAVYHDQAHLLYEQPPVPPASDAGSAQTALLPGQSTQDHHESDALLLPQDSAGEPDERTLYSDDSGCDEEPAKARSSVFMLPAVDMLPHNEESLKCPSAMAPPFLDPAIPTDQADSDCSEEPLKLSSAIPPPLVDAPAVFPKSRVQVASMDLPLCEKALAARESTWPPAEEDEPLHDWNLLSSVPPEVRVSVPNDDDPDMPINTLRVWVMSVSVAILLAWATFQLDINVTSGNGSIIVGAVLVQPICFGLGMLFSYLPYPRTWRFAHFINPGPFNLKEHTVITVVATVVTGPNLTLRYLGLMSMTPCRVSLADGVGSCEQQGVFPVGFLGLLNLSTPLLGLALAGLCDRLLVQPGKMTWPKELQTATMLTALHGVRRPNWSPTKVFYSLVGLSFAWEFVPQRLFTPLGSFSWPTWIAPESYGVNLTFGGFSGLGLSLVSLDWWSISAALGSPLLPPLYAVVNTFAGWLLGPCCVALILLLTNTQGSAHVPLNSPEPYFDNAGRVYRFEGLKPTMTNATSSIASLSRSLTLNETAYDEYSLAYLTPGSATSVSFSFAAASALLVHTLLFHWSDISPAAWTRARAEDGHHARLMRAYPAVPTWWYTALLVVCMALAIPTVSVYETGMPVWGLFLALALSLLFVVPVGLLKAITAMEVSLDDTASLLAGSMFSKSLAVPLFWLYSTATVQQAMLFLGCGKLGHYFKIPPRISLFVQGGAQLTASLVHWGLWAERGSKPVTQRSGCMQNMVSKVLYWGALQPHRTILRTHPWTLMFFLVGAILPLLVYLMRRLGARRLWRCNTDKICFPLLLSTAVSWPSNWSISFPSWFVARMVFEAFFGRRSQMNYWCGLALIVSAGLSVGTTVTVTLVALIWPHGGFKWYLPSPLDRAMEIQEGTGIVWKPLRAGQTFARPPSG